MMGQDLELGRQINRGVEQRLARRAHNPKVVGSIPTSAPNNPNAWSYGVVWLTRLPVTEESTGSSPVGTAINILSEILGGFANYFPFLFSINLAFLPFSPLN